MVLKHLCIFSSHKLMSVLYLLNSLDLMCYNQKDEEKEEEGKRIPFTMCLFLFVLNGVSKSVVTDNLYSF